MKPSIIFFGNERLVSGLPSTDAPLLKGLLEQGYRIAAVVSRYSETGNSRNNRPLEVAAIAQERGIPVLLPRKPLDIYDKLKAYAAEIGILSAYGNIIPQQIIDLFPRGIINLHPSLLPLHRGSIPIESVILNGDTTTGVSIMQLSKEMDAGPVYAQAQFELSGTESKLELYKSLSNIGTKLLLDTLPEILDGTLSPTPQDNTKATYDQLIKKSDAVIDWTKPAATLEREIRAYQYWPQSRTTLGSVDVIITRAHVGDGDYTVPTSDGTLAIDALKPLGKKEMPIQAFLQGYRSQL